MRRLAVVVSLVFTLVVALGTQNSRAFVVTPGSLTICQTATPYLSYVACGSPTPATRQLILPDKTISVTGGAPGPVGTTAYGVTVTSRIACFPLDEPVNAYVMGVPQGAAVLYQLSPLPSKPSNAFYVPVTVDPLTGSAALRLELYNKALGNAGLAVKANWPLEARDAVAPVVPPSAPTATATSTPRPAITVPASPPPPPTATPAQPLPTPAVTATNTPTSTPTATPSPTPTITPTPSGPTSTAQPTPTATSVTFTGPVRVRVCTDPTVVNGVTLAPDGQGITAYAQTKPGASCVPTVAFSTGEAPGGLDVTTPQIALQDGFAVFPFLEKSAGRLGAVAVTCASAGQVATGCTAFLINQTDYSWNNFTEAERTAEIASVTANVCPFAPNVVAMRLALLAQPLPAQPTAVPTATSPS